MNGLIPCGRSGDPKVDPAAAPCTACHAVVGAKRVMDYLTGIMVVVAIAVITAMGILYILSGVNVGLKKTAKEGITAVFIGVVLMLSAWLIVSTILRFMASDQFIQGGSTDGKGGFIGLMAGDGVYGLQCSTQSSANSAKLTAGRVQGGVGAASAGNGTCSILSSGACSVDALKNTCLASQAGRMSQVCNVESSGGQPDSKSGVDVCGNYDGRSFSGGLFQINVFSNGSMISSECANLGSKGTCAQKKGDVCINWTCKINNLSTFDSCMKKTFTASVNIAAACKLSSNGANLDPWRCTANKCGLGSTKGDMCK